MRKVTEKDLTLLYYGEHKEPDLAAIVAESAELSARFKALSDELELVDAYQPPERGVEYGAEVWQRISPHLIASQPHSKPRFSDWWQAISQPRFSTAGLFGLIIVATLAFTLGRNVDGPVPGITEPAPVAGFSMIDKGRLLSSSVSNHLEKLNVVLTEFAISNRQGVNDSDWAMDLLLTNRLYRQAASAGGDRRLAGFLASLEPLLIELAYEAHTASNNARERMQKEVRDDLLFKIRVMNKQLKTSRLTT